MNAFGFRAALFFMATVVFPASASAVTYTATLLHPAGFSSSAATGVSGASQVGYGILPKAADSIHALLWHGSAESVVDLNPAGWLGVSEAFGVWGGTQVGFGTPSFSGPSHALMWNGTAASAVDLHPAGFIQSYAYEISDDSQVGEGQGPDHALLWHGSAASAVDLNPAGFTHSSATGVSGATQVGHGNGPATGNRRHALLWNGTAASAVDLHPAGYFDSAAIGISGASQVGGGDGHALLWNGTAASVVDLHPAGFQFRYSAAMDVAGASQVGYGISFNNDNIRHALLWNGTAASVVNLEPFLSGLGPTFTASSAEDISDDGSIVGSATDTNGKSYAVLWTPVPEPTSCVLVACGLIGATFFFHRNRSRCQL